MNVESFSTKRGQEFAKSYLLATDCMMIVDESSRIKNPTAKRTEAICKRTADGGAESQCGWCKDKYGVSWQIIPKVLGELFSDKDRAKAGRIPQIRRLRAYDARKDLRVE